jgi:hypothetical protein
VRTLDDDLNSEARYLGVDLAVLQLVEWRFGGLFTRLRTVCLPVGHVRYLVNSPIPAAYRRRSARWAAADVAISTCSAT